MKYFQINVAASIVITKWNTCKQLNARTMTASHVNSKCQPVHMKTNHKCYIQHAKLWCTPECWL